MDFGSTSERSSANPQLTSLGSQAPHKPRAVLDGSLQKPLNPPCKPDEPIEDPVPEFPREFWSDLADLAVSRCLEGKVSPCSSYYTWNPEFGEVPIHVACKPNRSLHNFGNAHLELFCTEIAHSPKKFVRDVKRRRAKLGDAEQRSLIARVHKWVSAW
ncbi:unnamed protein product [Durusdinium trenchii]|uniref:Uncharacterized protein n=1 Tax=Durusdinium trenchii TaxID=1381693 RepID=A0ABP0MAN2_9DINO